VHAGSDHVGGENRGARSCRRDRGDDVGTATASAVLRTPPASALHVAQVALQLGGVSSVDVEQRILRECRADGGRRVL
jgi:hypothetical protein